MREQIAATLKDENVEGAEQRLTTLRRLEELVPERVGDLAAYAESIAQLKTIRERTERIDDLLEQAGTAAEAGEVVKAVEIYREVLDQAPGNATGLVGVKKLIERQQERVKDALARENVEEAGKEFETLNTMLEKFPGQQVAAVDIEALSSQVRTLRAKDEKIGGLEQQLPQPGEQVGDPVTTIPVIEEILDLDPDNEAAQSALQGLVAEHLQQLTAAAAACDHGGIDQALLAIGALGEKSPSSAGMVKGGMTDIVGQYETCVAEYVDDRTGRADAQWRSCRPAGEIRDLLAPLQVIKGYVPRGVAAQKVVSYEEFVEKDQRDCTGGDRKVARPSAWTEPKTGMEFVWLAGGLIFSKRSQAPHLRTIGPAYVHGVRGAGPLVQICATCDRLPARW